MGATGRRPADRDGRGFFAASGHSSSVLVFLREVRDRVGDSELRAVHTAVIIDRPAGESNANGPATGLEGADGGVALEFVVHANRDNGDGKIVFFEGEFGGAGADAFLDGIDEVLVLVVEGGREIFADGRQVFVEDQGEFKAVGFGDGGGNLVGGIGVLEEHGRGGVAGDDFCDRLAHVRAGGCLLGR